MENTMNLTPQVSRRVTEEVIRSIEQPEFTKTWHPHSHNTVLDAAYFACEQLKLEVEERQYSLSRNGGSLFGLWTLKIAGAAVGKHYCLGFRTSIIKEYAVGFCAMLTVIKCTNQVTPGRFFELRRHTSTLSLDAIKGLAVEAAGQAVERFSAVNTWHEGLKEKTLTKQEANDLTIRAMQQKILAPSKFSQFDKLFLSSRTPYGGERGGETLYGFHGALTELIRDHNFMTNVYENQQITKFVNSVM